MNLLVGDNQCLLDIEATVAEICIVHKNTFGFLYFLFSETKQTVLQGPVVRKPITTNP